ncbi:MAG TPA: twin-arginine translocase subunit TatC, partial [Bryobacteraceae bacterium]
MADEIEEPSAPGSQTPAQTPEEPVAVSAYSSTSDPYGEELAQQSAATATVEKTEPVPALTAPPPKSPPPAPPASKEDEEEEPDDEEEGMLRMSFMEHLGELRARILKALAGIVVAFLVSITFCKPLWEFVSSPAVEALKHLGINPPNLAQITPMENFNVIYIKLPLL